MPPKLFVTGGAGFIGSALVRRLCRDGASVVTIDRMGTGSSIESLAEADATGRHTLERVDCRDTAMLAELFARHRPTAVYHLAAETHVDRSIDSPRPFVESNVFGTFSVLEAARSYWNQLDEPDANRFRILHISTDEVFGSLGSEGQFTETTPYAPRSPYAASKAASDHLVRAWFETYGLPTLVSNCSNNFGPYQYPEKLIPLTIRNALDERQLPIYGKGDNVRDWLFVEDHVDALAAVMQRGVPGGTYNVGGGAERSNLTVVERLCAMLDERVPRKGGRYADLIGFVEDRPGHDFRYAIDSSKLQGELGWRPKHDFEAALEKTVDWYIANRDWCEHYGRQRIGLGAGAR